MSPTLLRKVDTDLSSVILDFNSGNPGFTLLGDSLDLGVIPINQGTQNSQYLQVQQPRDETDLVPVTFRLKAQNSSMDNLLTLARDLASALDRPGIYLFQPNGASAPRYFDAFKSDIPTLFRAEAALHSYIINKLTDPMGLPVTIYRRPYLFGSLVTESSATITNNPASGTNPKFRTVTAQGNMPTKAIVKVTPTGSTDDYVQVRVGRRSYGNTTQYAANWYGLAADADLYTGATIATDSTAAGSTRIEISFGTDTMARRARWLFTPSDVATLEGGFRIYARVQSSNDSTFRLQWRWSPANVDPVAFSNEGVLLAFPDGGSGTWLPIDLGKSRIERGLGTTFGLVGELWAARGSGSGNLYVDHIELWPSGPTPSIAADQSVLMSIRGFRDPYGSGQDRWDGDELVRPTVGPPVGPFTAGVVVDGTYRLDSLGEAEGTAPNTGFTLADGRHYVTFDVSIQRNAEAGLITMGEVAAVDLTDTATVNPSDIIAKDLFLNEGVASARKQVTLTFDRPTNNPQTQFQVRFTASAGTNRRITVHSIKHRFVPTVNSSRTFVLNGEYGIVAGGAPAAFLTTNTGVFAEPLTQEGPFLDLYPGANVLTYDFGEIPPGNFDDVDRRGIVARSIQARTATVVVSYYPRWSH